MWSHWGESIISIFSTVLTRRELLADFAAVSFFPPAKGESQTMDQRVSVLTLGVKDLGSSKRFYVDGFGWKPVHEDNEIIFFHAGGMVFALFLRDHLAADFQADPGTFGHAPMALAYHVRAKNEVNLLIQRAVAAGATILNQPGDTSWGGYSELFRRPPCGTQRGDWRLTAVCSFAEAHSKRPDDLFRNFGGTIVGRVRQWVARAFDTAKTMARFRYCGFDFRLRSVADRLEHWLSSAKS